MFFQVSILDNRHDMVIDVIDLLAWSSEDEKPEEAFVSKEVEVAVRVQPSRRVKLASSPATNSDNTIFSPEVNNSVSVITKNIPIEDKKTTKRQASNIISNDPRGLLPSKKEEIVQSNTSCVDEKSTNLICVWKSIEEYLRCDVCKQLLDVPVSLKCNHTFCSFCIRRYLELSGNDYCPSCRISASSTDIRLEPRLAGILTIIGKDRGRVRKTIRQALRGQQDDDSLTTPLCSLNETFNKQADLNDLFRTSGTSEPVGRTLLPVYKNLKDKQLKDLFISDGLEWHLFSNQDRDELIKTHKEFVFTLQSAFDAVRMGMYQDSPPSRGGLARSFNEEHRPRSILSSKWSKKSAYIARREQADGKETITSLARDANERMAEQLRLALKKKRRICPQGTEDYVATN